MENENTGFSVSQFLTQGSKKKSVSHTYSNEKKNNMHDALDCISDQYHAFLYISG